MTHVIVLSDTELVDIVSSLRANSQESFRRALAGHAESEQEFTRLESLRDKLSSPLRGETSTDDCDGTCEICKPLSSIWEYYQHTRHEANQELNRGTLARYRLCWLLTRRAHANRVMVV